MSTSFYQYQYCSLCKMNHKQRKKKHIYSNRHQEVLRNVICKFQIKVADAKTALSSPLVHGRGWEVDTQIWCYFCEVEVQKHKSEDDCVLVLGSFIKHLASADHARKMGDFFWQNIIPMDKKSDFTISGEEYNRFILLAEQVITGFRKNLEKQIKKEAANIVEADKRAVTVRWMGMQEQLLKQSFGSMSCQARVKRQYSTKQCGEVTQGRKTVAAFSEGLTCIVQQEEDKDHEDFHGNVFTGATPPWLREDEEKGSQEIGPTMEDYKKHLEKQRRQKLPACRVGAKFDHTVDTSSEWLPSFGRVWNAGRRLNSRRQYLNEKRQARTATVTSDEIKSQASSGASQVRSQDLEANGHAEQCQGLSLAGQVVPHRCKINYHSLPLFEFQAPVASLDQCNISPTPDGQLATAYAYCNGCKHSGLSSQPNTFMKTLNSSPAFLDNVASQSNLLDFAAASSPVYVVPYKRRKESCSSKVPPKFTNFIPIAASLLQTPRRTNFVKKT